MVFTIANNTHYIRRVQISPFEVIDAKERLYHCYGNRITASGALTFDTAEEAQRYIDRNGFSSDWHPVRYDSCCNTIVAENKSTATYRVVFNAYGIETEYGYVYQSEYAARYHAQKWLLEYGYNQTKVVKVETDDNGVQHREGVVVYDHTINNIRKL